MRTQKTAVKTATQKTAPKATQAKEVAKQLAAKLAADLAKAPASKSARKAVAKATVAAPVPVVSTKPQAQIDRAAMRRAAALKAWETMRARKGFDASAMAKAAWATRQENERIRAAARRMAARSICA